MPYIQNMKSYKCYKSIVQGLNCAHEICVPAAGMPPAEHENAKTRKPENGENGGNAKHENAKTAKTRKRQKRENGKNAKTRKAGKPFLQKAKKHYNQLSH